MSTDDMIIQTYGNRLRLRVCGVCIQEDKMLLVKHHTIGAAEYLWIPPGGGLEYGETIADCLIREYREEVGLEIEPSAFITIHEYLAPPLHAVELFYRVNVLSGELRLGSDPETSGHSTLFLEAAWIPVADIKDIPLANLHPAIRDIVTRGL